MNKGYIAITTTIFLSLLMLVVAITLGSTTLSTRFDTVDFTDKRVSYFIARSCLEYGRLQLSVDGDYVGNETVAFDNQQCALASIETAGANKIIKAQVVINKATTNLKLTINATDLSTVSLEEVISF